MDSSKLTEPGRKKELIPISLSISINGTYADNSATLPQTLLPFLAPVHAD